jgi:hypothetical protein
LYVGVCAYLLLYRSPKEGAGRSNRLGDANKNRHLRLIL